MDIIICIRKSDGKLKEQHLREAVSRRARVEMVEKLLIIIKIEFRGKWIRDWQIKNHWTREETVKSICRYYKGTGSSEYFFLCVFGWSIIHNPLSYPHSSVHLIFHTPDPFKLYTNISNHSYMSLTPLSNTLLLSYNTL